MLRCFYVACWVAALVGCVDQNSAQQPSPRSAVPTSTVLPAPSGPQNPPPANGSRPAATAPAADPLPPEILRDAAEVGRKQSKGLKKAETIVHRAFEFREKSVYQPNDSAKLVAVDVEFRNYGKNFDLDDVDILDGESNENFGSNPEIRFLNADGTLNPEAPDSDESRRPLRVLLVYAVPKNLKSIKLEYWGDGIASRAMALTPGGLRYDESRLIAGVQFWPYPRSLHFGDACRQGRWLLSELSEGAAVVDLGVWPPTVDHWDCNMLIGIEPAPQGGWIMLTRTGRTREDIRFPIWHHPTERPGSSPSAGAASGPRDHLRGIGVVDDKVFAYDGPFLYWYVDGRLERDDALGEARGVKDEFSIRYTHGTIDLADGRKLLLWDGDGYELVDGRWKNTWPLGIDDPYGFKSVPSADRGFYFLERRKVYRVQPGAERRQVMSAFDNIVGIESGPDGSILFQLGSGQNGVAVGLWFPKDDTYLPIEVREISAKTAAVELDDLYWSRDTRHFYVVSRNGVYTIPAENILHRERKKLPPRAE